VKVPWIISPVDVIVPTFFACTWVRKNVYETVVRAGGASRTEETTQLTARSASSGHQNLVHPLPFGSSA
jgi:hypothetical protein